MATPLETLELAAMSSAGIGGLITAARHAAGLTVADVARAIGVNWPAAKRYETGEAHPSPERLAQIVTALRAAHKLPPLSNPAPGDGVNG